MTNSDHSHEVRSEAYHIKEEVRLNVKRKAAESINTKPVKIISKDLKGKEDILNTKTFVICEDP